MDFVLFFFCCGNEEKRKPNKMAGLLRVNNHTRLIASYFHIHLSLMLQNKTKQKPLLGSVLAMQAQYCSS